MAQLHAVEQIRPAERTGRPGRIAGGLFLFTGGIHLGIVLSAWGYWLWSVPALAFLVPSAIAHWRRRQPRAESRIR